MSWIVGAMVLAVSSAAWGGESLQAITKPSHDVTLTFSHPGQVAKLLVQEGDTVKAGQAVVVQDDREEAAAMAIDKAKSEDTTEIEAQKAVLDQKEVDYKKFLWAFDHGGVKSQYEVDSARIEVVINQARLKLAQFEHEQNIRKYEQTKAGVDRMTLYSPIGGHVESTLVKVGEGVEPSTKVMRIVQTDPLWIEVPVPFAEGRQLVKGQTAKVTFSDKSVGPATIINVASVADSASDTLTVRVELANDKNPRPAGERVTVSFTETAKVADGTAEPKADLSTR